MVHFMLRAFFCASIADVCTNLAQLMGEVRSSTDESGCLPANCGAIQIKPNATRHHLHVRFLQTGAGAMLALLSAGDALANT
jgi:hypothetical protein